MHDRLFRHINPKLGANATDKLAVPSRLREFALSA
jgi:hypothetical protein